MKLKLLCILICCYATIKAQNSSPNCNVTLQNNTIFEAHPESLEEYRLFNEFSKEYKVNSSNKSAAAAYVIPVVFHVYGTSHSGQSVSYAKIETALAKLNDDFQGLNADYNTVDPMFTSIRSTLDIEFKLAKIDPNGGCSTGVIFHDVMSGFGNGGGYDALIQSDAWDNYKYMNVYIQNDLYDDANLYNSGVAWYPNTWMSDNNLSRVVYNGAYIHGNTNDEFASILSHEFGHWLNLKHTFDGGCSGTDEVADTPSEDGNHTLGCSAGTNCTGDYVNYENYMGYNGASGCYKMFTQGQITRMTAALTHATRQPLWQAANLIATGVDDAASSSAVTSNISGLQEEDANDGSFTTTATVTVSGTTFVNSSGSLVNGVDYNLSLPAGLSATVTLLSNTEAQISFTGNATNHEVVNNAAGGITFLNPAITGGTGTLNCTGVYWNFKYYDAYGIFYVDNADITVNSGATWQWFAIEADADDYSFGAFVDGGDLKLETYTKAIISEGATRNITYLGTNEPVDGTRNFVAGGAYPDLHNLRDASYTTWDGQTGYIGFEYAINGRTCYGWFHIAVTADGSEYTITDYAYNTEPNATIYTPTINTGSAFSDISEFYEADINDGSFTTVSTISLLGTTFTASSGILTSSVDYTVSFPTGLNAVVTLTSTTEAQLSLTGTAAAHEVANNTTGNITFLDSAITGGVATLSAATIAYDVKFYDAYGIFYVDNADMTVNSGAIWQWFAIEPDADDSSFGVFVDGGDLKLETYTKAIISEGATRNITYLGYNEPVDGTRNFVAGAAYPDLHNLRDASYTVWDGQEGYIGFEYAINGRTCYGWFHIVVSADGSEYSLLDYAYNTEPTATIYTPSNLSVGDDMYNVNEFSVYPNPFYNEFKIVNNSTGNAKISVVIFNSLGQQVFGNNYSGFDKTITISNLEIAKGVYFVKILSGNKTVSVKQLVRK
ncbi:MAG: hypothetical protein COA88_02630 [Kordia sp.]|nr:MAG: hypothetical protein COA88_02630 [Kordia sp.]